MFFRRKRQSTAERRQAYRKRQSKAYSLGVHLVTPAGVTAGEFVDLSVSGVASRFLLEQDPQLVEDDVVELTIQSLSHGQVTTPARVVYNKQDGDRHIRYGFQFINVGNLYSQLDGFYSRLFNRRASQRVRPSLDRKVRLAMQWSGGEVEANMHEISATGVGLILPVSEASRLHGVDQVGVRFRLPGVREPFDGAARLVNRKVVGEHAYLGLAFDLEDPEGLARVHEHLVRYVDERAAEMERWESSWS